MKYYDFSTYCVYYNILKSKKSMKIHTEYAVRIQYFAPFHTFSLSLHFSLMLIQQSTNQSPVNRQVDASVKHFYHATPGELIIFSPLIPYVTYWLISGKTLFCGD